jgi:nucleoside-diphosphate-sugar epimerase
MAGHELGEAFNFGNGRPVTVLEIVDQIGKVLGRTDLAPIIRSNAPNEIPAQWLDASKAASRLDWTPGLTLAEGLRRTAEWYRAVLA